MNVKIKKIIFLATIFLLAVSSVNAQKKRAQTSMKFLSVSPSAKASAMSDAVTAVDMGAYGAYYNPATLANTDQSLLVSAGAVQWITDINHSSLSMVYKHGDGKLGVFGFNIVSVDYGDILSTVVDGSVPEGYRDNGTINPVAMVVGLSYANAITDQFSVGANFRYAYQDLGAVAVSGNNTDGYVTESFSASTGVIDFGVLYKTGFESLNFAMALRNFSPEVSFDDEESELPLTFKIGVAMDVLDLTDFEENHSLIVSIDANRPRDFDEQLLFGLEYGFMNRFILRGGYGFPKDEEALAFGFGLNQPFGKIDLSVDYSYTQFGVFGEVNRFSVQLGF